MSLCSLPLYIKSRTDSYQILMALILVSYEIGYILSKYVVIRATYKRVIVLCVGLFGLLLGLSDPLIYAGSLNICMAVIIASRFF